MYQGVQKSFWCRKQNVSKIQFYYRKKVSQNYIWFFGLSPSPTVEGLSTHPVFTFFNSAVKITTTTTISQPIDNDAILKSISPNIMRSLMSKGWSGHDACYPSCRSLWVQTWSLPTVVLQYQLTTVFTSFLANYKFLQSHLSIRNVLAGNFPQK